MPLADGKVVAPPAAEQDAMLLAIEDMLAKGPNKTHLATDWKTAVAEAAKTAVPPSDKEAFKKSTDKIAVATKVLRAAETTATQLAGQMEDLERKTTELRTKQKANAEEVDKARSAHDAAHVSHRELPLPKAPIPAGNTAEEAPAPAEGARARESPAERALSGSLMRTTSWASRPSRGMAPIHWTVTQPLESPTSSIADGSWTTSASSSRSS